VAIPTPSLRTGLIGASGARKQITAG
jgi:hypothetical protein